MDEIVKTVGMAFRRPLGMLVWVPAKVLRLLKQLLEYEEFKGALEALFKAVAETLMKLLMVCLEEEQMQEWENGGMATGGGLFDV